MKKKEFEICLLTPNNTMLNGCPLFYNYIYFNEVLDANEEIKLIFRSNSVDGVFSYAQPQRLISTIIDFNDVENVRKYE